MGLTRNARSVAEVLAIDLGSKTTKAALLRRKGDSIVLLRKGSIPTPPELKSLSAAAPLAEHLIAVHRALKAPRRQTVIALSPNLALLTSTELPPLPPSDLRRMIRLNPKSYVQQELKDHWFDCHVGSTVAESEAADGQRGRRRARVWVAAAPMATVAIVEEACRTAGLRPAGITLQSVGLAAASMLLPADVSRETVVMLDIGLQSTTICVVRGGEPLLVRVVNQGAERLQEAIEQVSRGEPKTPTGDGDALHDVLQRTVQGLAREVEVSIRFVTSKHEASASQVFVCGGSARSGLVIQALEGELNLPCRPWKPEPDQLATSTPALQSELDFDAPQFAVTLGVARSALRSDACGINLLAEQLEAQERRRRDPFRRAAVVAALLLLGAALWVGQLSLKLRSLRAELADGQDRLDQFRKSSAQTLESARRVGDLDRAVQALQRQASHREAWGSILNSLQFASVPQIQFHRLRLDQVLNREKLPPAKPADPKAPTPERPPNIREHLVLTITGKNYGPDARLDELISALENDAHLKSRLIGKPPVLLRDLQPRQVDPLDARRAFRLFTIECKLSEFLYTHD
jgi:type IV pilus assembly protein PilM